jgi:hypothetical protein
LSAVLFSTNPWFSSAVATQFLDGRHFVWVSEHFDTGSTSSISTASFTAPSSNPAEIYRRLHADWREDKHSDLIKRYRKTFRRLARIWLAAKVISRDQHDEIVKSVPGFAIWRPVLYVIPKEPIVRAGRLRAVNAGARAAYGPEFQIIDLMPHEFSIVEWKM